jgi:RimJ/RimL family protein N-acetyltransferase
MEKNIIFRSGNMVDLCVKNKSLHLENCYRWLNDKEVLQWILMRYPLTLIEEEDWFNKPTPNPKTDIVLAIVLKNGVHIGMAGLHKIDYVSGVAESGIFIGAKEHWRNGYATEAESLIGKYAFEDLGLRKITAHIFADNTASLMAAKKNGAVEEGVLRQHIWKNGKYNDLIVLAVFRDDQPKN